MKRKMFAVLLFALTAAFIFGAVSYGYAAPRPGSSHSIAAPRFGPGWRGHSVRPHHSFRPGPGRHFGPPPPPPPRRYGPPPTPYWAHRPHRHHDYYSYRDDCIASGLMFFLGAIASNGYRY